MSVEPLKGASLGHLGGDYRVEGEILQVVDKGLGSYLFVIGGRSMVFDIRSGERPVDLLLRAKRELSAV